MDETWVVVEEFQDYQVSDHGRVLKTATGKIMKESYTRQGAVKIGFVEAGIQYTRSVKVLVAESFLETPSENFDTPINLDGNQRNNHVENLLWRPRYFAIKYSRQFHEYTPGQSMGPIASTETRHVYIDMVEAALTNGLLIYDVWRSVHHGFKVFPTGDRFVLLK